MWLNAIASLPISSSVGGSMRWFQSPRAMPAAPSASCWTGFEMRRATRAALTPPKSSMTSVRAASSERVCTICASMRFLETPTRAVPHFWPFTRIGTAKSRTDWRATVVSCSMGCIARAASTSTLPFSGMPTRSGWRLWAATLASASSTIAYTTSGSPATRATFCSSAVKL